MAILTKEIKDEYVILIALKLGYNSSVGDTQQSYINAIQSKIDNLIDPLYADIILRDPEVQNKLTELEVLKQQKIDQAKPIPK